MTFITEKNLGLEVQTEASLVIGAKGFKKLGGLTVNVENPRLSFIQVCNAFFPPPAYRESRGERCVIDPFARIGGEGFGFERNSTDELEGFPHYAGVSIGHDVHIKAFSAVDRGVFEDTTIGDGTKIDNLVHIAHNCKVGKNCLLVAGTVLGGGVEIGDNCYLMIGAQIKPHVKIGKGVQVGMGAVVRHDIPDHETVVGNPAHKLEKEIPT